MADWKIELCEYKKLAEDTKSSSFRDSLGLLDFQRANEELAKITVDELTPSMVQTVSEIFGFLRNSCVQSSTNQNFILDTSLLANAKTLLFKCMSPVFCEKYGKELNKFIVTAIQFLGNLVVQNDEAKDEVWRIYFPDFFFECMANLGDPEKDILCMVLYNCMKDKNELLASDEDYWLLVSVLEHCQKFDDVEWGLFIVENIIVSKSFNLFYNRLADYPHHKRFILYVIQCHVESDSTEIPESVFLFLSNTFSTKMKCILQLAENITRELLEETFLLYKILQVLSVASQNIEKYPKLRIEEDFLGSIVELLKDISNSKYSYYFSKESDINSSQPDEKHPSFGFKKNLIQLIANLLYKNKLFQDLIRDKEGINPLLNATVIDDQNPYIMQWAIFAIRNLCEENLQNQGYIKKLEKQGLAPNHFCGSCNISVTLKDGKIKFFQN